MEKTYDFIFGAQYYRAPTPAPENWESDLKRMKELGLDSVKFWVQWRWSHRGEDTFYFEDTDRLMDLAYKYGLKVTINVIFDVVPQWIVKKYPESKIVLANGHVAEPCAVSSRQIGGFPGICYNHPEARRERMKFLKKTAEHYKNHPAINGFCYNNFNCSLADDKIIQDGLQGTKLLVMPCCYALSRKTAEAIDAFVQNGGSVLCEAHLGGFDLDRGRHSYKMPGQGLDEKWKILEEYTTSSFHLHLEKDGELDMRGFNEDMKKALLSYGTEGGKYFGIALNDGSVISGAERFACLKADGAEVIGTFNGAPCIIKKKVGRGTVYYVGTDIGVGAEKDRDAFERFITFVARDAGAAQNPYSAHRGVHADTLLRSIVTVTNVSEADAVLHLKDGFKGLFFGKIVTDGKVTVPAKTSEIFVKG